METTVFKTSLKNLSGQLKGITLQLGYGYNAVPYKSLREFGNAILNLEAQGQSFDVRQVWTTEGVFEVRSFDKLAELLNAGKVTGIQFYAYYIAKDMVDYLKNSFNTTD